VFTDNDANLGVLSEHLRGAAVGHSDVAYLNGSVGIGGGFLVGGVPLSGARGYAGEVGHLLVDGSSTQQCRCGNVGCWETKVGENQLLMLAGRLAGGGPEGVDEVIAAADNGDERAGRALDEVGHWLGVGLRAVINVFNPEVVVICGGVTLAGDHLFIPLRRETARRAFKPAVAACRIVPGELVGTAGVYGAAKTFLDA
jgi:predicted NBD/HSP70 family sugar kinase